MSLASRIALAFIRVYKIVLSPLFAGSCRYTPGCADYMSESISRFGFIRGGWLGTKRLCKCHPLGGHGFDPVPTDLNHGLSSHPSITRSVPRSTDLWINRRSPAHELNRSTDGT